MEKEDEGDKFGQIRGIFSRFSEENKDKLLEAAKSLLRVQREEAASVSQNGMVEGCYPEK